MAAFDLAPKLEGLAEGQVGIQWKEMPAPGESSSEARKLTGTAAFGSGRLQWSRFTEELEGKRALANLSRGGWRGRYGSGGELSAETARSRTTRELRILD